MSAADPQLHVTPYSKCEVRLGSLHAHAACSILRDYSAKVCWAVQWIRGQNAVMQCCAAGGPLHHWLILQWEWH